MEFVNFLITICQAIGLWLIFAAAFVVVSILFVFWYPFFIPIAIAFGIWRAIKAK